MNFLDLTIGIAFRNIISLHQLTKPEMQNQTPEHYKNGVYKLTSNTCHRSYIGQKSRSLKFRFQERTRYIKHNEPQSAYALHILNGRHEYDTISDTMSLLQHINKPSLLLPYEEITYNYFIITINSFQNNTQMNKILCSNYFTTDIIRHNPPNILINTATSNRPNQFHSTLHTRHSSTQVILPIHQI